MIKGIGCLIYDIDKDMFLLQQRGKNSSHSLKLGLWGGKMEPGENFGEALKREVREELTTSPEVEKLYPLDTFLSYDNKFVYYSFLMIVNKYDDFTINASETFDFVWMPFKYLERLDLHPGFRKTFMKKKSYIEEIIYTYK